MRRFVAARQTILLLITTYVLAACMPWNPFSTVVSTTVLTAPSGITVSVASNGTYTIKGVINHVPTHTPAWTFGGSVGQALTNVVKHAGSDRIGSYREIRFNYSADALRSGSIRTYTSKPVVLFTDTYLSAASNNAPFPHLTTYPQHLYHLSYSGTFAHYSFASLPGESPWTFFDDLGHAFILSPASNFMIASMTQEKDGSITSGINAAITRLPRGFTHKTLLVIDQGINATYETWGHALTDLQGKQRPANDADITLNYLGYWTDTGAAYYYNFDAHKGYVGTLLAVRDSFQRLGIPLGYMELDSWWYPKGSADTWQGDATNSRGGIYTYSAAPDLFPHGLQGFEQQMRLPLGTHARWIDPSSPYRQEYTMSNNVSIDPRYWNTIATYLEQGGVITYKQDWLGQRAQTATNLTDPAAFMDTMAHAMAAHGITIQYCMALPQHFLQSSEYNNVTTIRVSDDRFNRSRWNQFLYASRLAGALGVWPWADVFMSSERYNLLLATLSAGMVGVGDAIGSENKANLFQSMRSDGVIVKPDAPIVPLDAIYIQDAEALDTPMVASTYTDHAGLKTFYVFAYKRGAHTQFTLSPAALGVTGRVYVYNYFTGKGSVVEAGSTYSAHVSDAAYYIVAPIGASGIAFLGDAGTFVSSGKKRIVQVVDNGTVQATIAFARGETAVKIFGYAPSAPVITASTGSIRSLAYCNSISCGSTHLFSVVVAPAPGRSAVIHVGVGTV